MGEDFCIVRARIFEYLWRQKTLDLGTRRLIFLSRSKEGSSQQAPKKPCGFGGDAAASASPVGGEDRTLINHG